MDKLDWVRRLNYYGGSAGGSKYIVSIDPDELISAATESTGLSDFGDPGWEMPFRKLISSLEKDVELHTLGRLMTRGDMLRALRNRLFVTEHLKQNPRILDEKIDSPLVVVGQGRTGTSILFELLWLDPNHRAPLAWEASCPVTPPEETLAEGISRTQIAEPVNEFWADIQPEIKSAHEHRWDLPVECPRIMESDFTAVWWIMFYAAWDFLAWHNETQPSSAYDWHKFVLQVLQYGQTTKRWLLKSPAHIRYIDQLLIRYPHAKVIHTHRDPLKSIASTAKLTEIVRSSRANNIDTNMLGQLIMMGYELGMKKIIDERASGIIPAGQIADIHFHDLMRDPVAAIESVYDQLKLEFSDGFAQNIRQYLLEKPKGKFGVHEYKAEDFGLDNKQIRDKFRFYTEHYGIVLEN